MTLLSSVRQRSKSPLVLRGGVRSILQEETDDGDVAVVGGEVERGLHLLVGLIHVCPVLQQQLDHLRRPLLCSDEQWREAIEPRQVGVGTVLQEHFGDLRELLGCGLDQRRGSTIRGRPVYFDATLIGRPLQQSPCGVRLPTVRRNQQRGLFGPVPPNLAAVHHHKALRVKLSVGDVELLELG